MAITNSIARLVSGTVGVVGLSCVLGASPAQALGITNGSFSNGFSGWQTLGNSQIVDSNGSDAAQIITSGAFAGDIEGFLGLSIGQLTTLSGETPTNGAAFKQTFFANAGDVISFDWIFQAGDYVPFDDFAFTSLSSSADLLASVATVGNFQNSGLKNYSWTIASDGTYTLGFGVLNALDTGLNSSLTVDNVTSSATAVPTPALVPGAIALTASLLRKRKSEAAAQKAEA